MTLSKRDISVTIGGVQFDTAVFPGSGTFDYTSSELCRRAVKDMGAVVIKSVCWERQEGNPPPRVVELPYGMINSIGIPSVAYSEFVRDTLPLYRECGRPVILSAAGASAGAYKRIVEQAAEEPGIAAIELNLSCPNVVSGLPFSSDPRILAETVGGLRKLTAKPLIAKLSPVSAVITDVARAAEDCGIDALTLANTFPAMVIDVKSQRPVLGNVTGGASGPCIKPLTMAVVYRVFNAVHIPLIASGGICCADDAIEYFLAGASAVQIGSGFFSNPNLFSEVHAGILEYLAACGAACLGEIIGKAHV